MRLTVSSPKNSKTNKNKPKESISYLWDLESCAVINDDRALILSARSQSAALCSCCCFGELPYNLSGLQGLTPLPARGSERWELLANVTLLLSCLLLPIGPHRGTANGHKHHRISPPLTSHGRCQQVSSTLWPAGAKQFGISLHQQTPIMRTQVCETSK